VNQLQSNELGLLGTIGQNSKKSPFRPIRSLVILLILIVSLTSLVLSGKSLQPKLGLDLRGGTTIVLQPQLTDIGKITPDSVAQAISILRQRIDGVGVSESEIRAEGSGAATKIIVSVPGTTQRELVALVGQTAKLSIRPVLFAASASTINEAVEFPAYIDAQSRDSFKSLNCNNEVTSSMDDPIKYLFSCDEGKGTKYILGASKVEGSQVASAQFSRDNGLGWITTINFDGPGQAYFGELTSKIATLPSPLNQIAIVLDGKVVTAPRVDGPLTGGTVSIYGNFTQEYASGLANILKYGSLPFSFEVSEVQQISASLGASQLKSGIAAGLLGLLLISIYIFFYYRALGILAVGSLLVAFVITYEIFILLGTVIGLTLTLAGIAGAIVSIGVTADSFIVYFERVRDELRVGTSLQLSLIRGWAKARRTIWVADAVSLIAAFVLYFGTTGNVRGFAFTLGLTTIIDLVIVYFFTRPALVLLAKLSFFAKGHRLSGLSQESIGTVSDSSKKRRFNLDEIGGKLFRGETSLNVVAKPKRWYVFSAVLIAISAASLGISGLNLGLEFKGGSVNTVTTSQPSTEKAQKVLSSIGYAEQAVIQIVGKDKVRIETSQLSIEAANNLAVALAAEFNAPIETIDSQSVGPSWGAEISKKAFFALIWFIVILIIYLAIALNIKMAIAALIAVVHDVFITVGIYSLVGLKVTPAAAIGFLTILGYSLYDTVVVFDKVRENVKQMANRSLDEYKRVVNLALNQTLIRSLNTSIVAIIPIASILFVGGYLLEADTLKDISLALVIGQSIGTYSSIFIAAPGLVALNRNSFRKQRTYIASDPMSFEKILKPDVAIVTYETSFENSHFAEFSEKQVPLFFSSFSKNPQAWDQLWIDSPIPHTVEECNRIVKTKISNRLSGSAYYFLSNHDHNQIHGFFTITVDLINSDVVLELLALPTSGSMVLENAVKDLTQHFHEKGFYRVSFVLPAHIFSAFEENVATMDTEGTLKEARLSRSGQRIDMTLLSSRSFR
jgi:protein-export membrane protein SecD/preprotein translocase SecF subunit